MSFVQFSNWQIFDDQAARKYVSVAEYKAFLRVADRMAPRIRALCYVIALAGCRISEAVSLTHANLDAERGVIIFRTLKRRRLCFRAVPVPHAVLAMLADLPTRHSDRLFPMHRTTAYRHVKLVMHISGITGRHASPKGLRHSYGIRSAESSVPLPVIQRTMGHASPATTLIYMDAAGIEEQRRFVSRTWLLP